MENQGDEKEEARNGRRRRRTAAVAAGGARGGSRRGKRLARSNQGKRVRRRRHLDFLVDHSNSDVRPQPVNVLDLLTMVFLLAVTVMLRRLVSSPPSEPPSRTPPALTVVPPPFASSASPALSSPSLAVQPETSLSRSEFQKGDGRRAD
eukprot:764106-Hanusia_phi.AAC.7